MAVCLAPESVNPVNPVNQSSSPADRNNEAPLVQRPDKELLKPWRVCIIDDSLGDRAHIRRSLLGGSERQLTFVEAATAAGGITAVLGAVPPHDCIVLNYNLPDMLAPDVLAAVVGRDGMPICPVVVVTSGANRDDGRLALRAGAQDYIAKDWTNPNSLCRAVENASESWAMARELRQSKGALRLVTDRETFRSVFGDATRGLTDEHALKRVAAHMLGVHLQVNRVLYGEVTADAVVVVGPSYVNGVHQIDGAHRLEDFGPELLESLKRGENQIVADMRSDAGYSASEKAAYAAMHIVANLGIPILKGDQLVAVLGVHQNVPRVWTPEDIALAREIAQRTWAAVEQVRSEAKLLASRIQLSQIVAIMPSFSAVLRGPSHVVELANQAFYDLVQHGPEILGQTYADAFPELATQPFLGLLDTVFRTGEKFEASGMRAIVRRGAGDGVAEIFVDFVYLPMCEAAGRVSGIFVHGVDRTAEVKATQALARGTRELRSVTENTPDGLARFDRQLRHVFVNSVIEKSMNQSVAAILGKTHRQLGVSKKLRDQWEKAIRYVFDHAKDSLLEFSVGTVQGGLRHFSCRLVPEFNEAGQVESALGVTHDITNRRAFEQRLLEQDLRKDEFLATLAHELRNPLAPIRTGLQLLKFAPRSEEVVARTLPVMERQLGQLVRLVDDLLDVSRISSGKIVLKRERISFQDIAAAALEASRPAIDAAGHTLSIDWPTEAVWLDADPTRLSQIFSNLLTNSAKYMPCGGQIKFAARLHLDNLVVSVEDTGMGIPADMLGLVFDMFTQINRTLDRAQGGLGIGLSLVKTLVEMHGGSVQAASDGIDQGSIFTVTLPIDKAPAIVPNPAQPLSAAAGFARHRILVVDDNVDAAETMVMLLDLSGHDACVAFSGQEALNVAARFLPDVVFLDIGLPGMNGYEVARQLQASPATASAKLIALTGWGTEEDIRKSKMAGFHAHLTKPVDPNAIDAILATFLLT